MAEIDQNTNPPVELEEVSEEQVLSEELAAQQLAQHLPLAGEAPFHPVEVVHRQPEATAHLMQRPGLKAPGIGVYLTVVQVEAGIENMHQLSWHEVQPGLLQGLAMGGALG